MKSNERRELRLRAAEKANALFVKQPTGAPREKVVAEAIRTQNFIERETLRKSLHGDTIIQVLERQIGSTLDLKDFPPSTLAGKNGRPVARIHEIATGFVPEGFGTGFLVAPNILITNNHVFPTIQHALTCGANFLHEKDKDNHILNGVTFRILPDTFFYTNADLDFTLVYVETQSIEGTMDLKDIGCLPLIATKGKTIIGSAISIIQYPLGGHKRYAFEQNTVTDIDDLQGIIQYTTDTLPASSGAPCFNDSFEVVALHYTGIPSIVDGKWRTKKGEVWDKETMSENDILWVANAGKSISAIIASLKSIRFSEKDRPFVDLVLRNSADPLLAGTSVKPVESGSPVNEKNLPAMNNLVLNFNGPTNVYISQSAGQPVLAAAEPGPAVAIATEAKIRFDENYSNRRGYSETFLQGFRVPRPKVIQPRQKELYKPFGSSLPLILKYHNYSLVMNKKRRFQMWSAVNVDYAETVRDTRDRDDFGNDSNAWRTDKRLPVRYQVTGEEFYDPATRVDKGHMVRRDDNCWAKHADPLGIEYANSDSFHYTNCLPQHELFNRDMFGVKGLWGVLENEIKKQLTVANDPRRDFGQKASILAGPVLDNEKDPEYNEIQYPLEFWKVFAIVSETDGNLVYGFLLSQKDKVDEFGLEVEALPRFNATVKALQVSLREIEEKSGIIFDDSLHDFDVLKDAPDATEPLLGDMSNFKPKRL
jgi:endonuclease G